VRRAVSGLVLLISLYGAAAGWAASPDAAVSGVVRDSHGTPQMGALVVLMDAASATIASAFTDDHGRYILPSVLPGRYQVRATAAFFVPATKPNLRLQAGAQAIVNLTMNTLFEVENWLPAQRRMSDEPADDWKWTLKATASRPLLRLTDPDDDEPISSSGEAPHKAVDQGRVMVLSGAGVFGEGGTHQVLVLNRTIENNDSAMFRADVGDPMSPYPSGGSVTVSAGYERRSVLGGSTRLVSIVQSHPELMDAGTAGFEVVELASTQQIELGDLVEIDAGTLMEAERLERTRVLTRPFLHATVRASDDLLLEYRYARSRELESSEDLDRLKPSVAVLSDAQGRPLDPDGGHNEIAVSRKLGDKRVLTFAAYADRFNAATLTGGGAIDRSAIESMPMIADPTTGTFRFAGPAYSAKGVSVTYVEPITPALSAIFEYDLGTALVCDGGGSPALANLPSNLVAKTEPAARAAIRGNIARSGTALKAEYRWQPGDTITEVNAYNATPNQAYLTLFVRQRLWAGRFLPSGLDAVVEATNLLEQGYQPVLAPDGKTLFLAQVPRAIQAGLAFNF
jgi:hypothetical protein